MQDQAVDDVAPANPRSLEATDDAIGRDVRLRQDRVHAIALFGVLETTVRKLNTEHVFGTVDPAPIVPGFPADTESHPSPIRQGFDEHIYLPEHLQDLATAPTTDLAHEHALRPAAQ